MNDKDNVKQEIIEKEKGSIQLAEEFANTFLDDYLKLPKEDSRRFDLLKTFQQGFLAGYRCGQTKLLSDLDEVIWGSENGFNLFPNSKGA